MKEIDAFSAVLGITQDELDLTYLDEARRIEEQMKKFYLWFFGEIDKLKDGKLKLSLLRTNLSAILNFIFIKLKKTSSLK